VADRGQAAARDHAGLAGHGQLIRTLGSSAE
jgi:hypothetical protein